MITIEGSTSFYERTVPALARFANVELILGDSKEVLPEILPTLTGPAMFWLDSHWMNGEDSFGRQDDVP